MEKTVVTVRIVNPLVDVNGLTHRDHLVINAICTSEPPHRMDDCRNVYVAGWMTKETETPVLALDKFKSNLSSRIYDDVNIELIVIDEIDESIPKYRN